MQRNDIRKLVLDGTPLLEGDETARMMAGVYPGPWGYQENGAHETSFWKSTIAVMKLWDPAFTLTPANLPSIYAFMVDHIESGQPGVARIAPTHDMRERLPLLSLPVLVLTSENEPLRTAFERTLDRLEDGRGHIFPGSHPLHHVERAAEYVDVIAKFFAE